jgi:hypothetical protein
LIIWGEDDSIIDIEDAFIFKRDMCDAELKIIPDCGHSPQEEKPFETAKFIAEFLNETVEEPEEEIPEEAVTEEKIEKEDNSKIQKSVEHIMQASGHYIRKLKMRRLIDRWSFGIFVLIVFVKVLQFLKKLGFTAEENGWRKATGIFLRNEHSKFILAIFRLKYYIESVKPAKIQDAKDILIERLADFLRKNPACHWTLEWGFLRVRRKKVFFTDITEVEFDNDGRLVRLVPYLDKTRPAFNLLNDEIIQMALEQMIVRYNEFRKMDDRKRSWTIHKHLQRWAKKYKNLPYPGRQELSLLFDRILNGTIIQVETLTDDSELFLRRRLATPNLKDRRHPGFGLLNIVCRFTDDLSEADLWFQHHHVPVDGMPMQEMLEQLKQEWGEVGPLKYPALDSKAAKPEIFYFGNRVFRARSYVSFDNFLKVRKHVNEKYYAEMGGPATISSMIIWGLAQQEYFKNRKFVFPIDTSLIVDYPQDRSLSLIIIRPSKFFNKQDPLKGFIEYQREFNQRLFATRIGKSETYELLELYSMIHPVFYYIGRYLMPKAFSEILGTAGVTVLRNAEMFVSPLTDLSFNGFLALGNMRMPTEDGKTAGAISSCGSREQVREYLTAIHNMSQEYHDYLKVEL